jgi:hypothetical protein
MTDEQRIRFKSGTRGQAMFAEEAPHLIIVGGAITTTGRFHRFDESLCHLSADGIIRRYGREIGTAEDIEHLPSDGMSPEPKETP